MYPRLIIAAVASLFAASSSLAAPVELEVILGDPKTETELRLKTDRMRDLPGGAKEPVYVKKTPAKGNVFLNLVVYIAHEGDSFPLSADEIRFHDRNDKTYPLFDWFKEEGLAEVRGESVTIEARTALNLTVEVPETEVPNLRLSLLGDTHSLGKEMAEMAYSGLSSSLVSSEILTELRLKTDQRRQLSGGESEPVYKMHRPQNGNVFVATTLYLSAPTPRSLRQEDFSLYVDGQRFKPFDLYRESGLVEERQKIFYITDKSIFHITTELPEAVAGQATLWIAGTELGPLFDLSAQDEEP